MKKNTISTKIKLLGAIISIFMITILVTIIHLNNKNKKWLLRLKTFLMQTGLQYKISWLGMKISIGGTLLQKRNLLLWCLRSRRCSLRLLGWCFIFLILKVGACRSQNFLKAYLFVFAWVAWCFLMRL